MYKEIEKELALEFYNYIETCDNQCELTNQELIDNFISDVINNYNEKHTGNEIIFTITELPRNAFAFDVWSINGGKNEN
jgi:hypothetical protein